MLTLLKKSIYVCKLNLWRISVSPPPSNSPILPPTPHPLWSPLPIMSYSLCYRGCWKRSNWSSMLFTNTSWNVLLFEYVAIACFTIFRISWHQLTGEKPGVHVEQLSDNSLSVKFRMIYLGAAILELDLTAKKPIGCTLNTSSAIEDVETGSLDLLWFVH